MRATGAGKAPPGVAASLSAVCNSSVSTLATNMSCCSRIENEVLASFYTIAGATSFLGGECVHDILRVHLTLSGLRLSVATDQVSQQVLQQMSNDELAHLIPALQKTEFIRNINLNSVSTTTRDSVDVDTVDLECDVATNKILNLLL